MSALAPGWDVETLRVGLDDLEAFDAVLAAEVLPPPLRRRLVTVALSGEFEPATEAVARVLQRPDLDWHDLFSIMNNTRTNAEVVTALLEHPAADLSLLVRMAERVYHGDDQRLRDLLLDHLPARLADLRLLIEALLLLIYEAGGLEDGVGGYAAALAAGGRDAVDTAKVLAQDMLYPDFVFATVGIHAALPH